jgi:hypothetical protein
VATHRLRTEADNHNRGLYGNNQAVYGLLRYGVPVKIEAGKVTETVHLINWTEPEKNDFAIAEEVTLRGNHERRPDIVVYVNGIAVGVLELKRSAVSIGDGIRQSLSNQQPEFNEWFFSTVQLIFAGNDSEGLQYGTIDTPEYFLKWKEDRFDHSPLQLHLVQGRQSASAFRPCATVSFSDTPNSSARFSSSAPRSSFFGTPWLSLFPCSRRPPHRFAPIASYTRMSPPPPLTGSDSGAACVGGSNQAPRRAGGSATVDVCSVYHGGVISSFTVTSPLSAR